MAISFSAALAGAGLCAWLLTSRATVPVASPATSTSCVSSRISALTVSKHPSPAQDLGRSDLFGLGVISLGDRPWVVFDQADKSMWRGKPVSLGDGSELALRRAANPDGVISGLPGIAKSNTRPGRQLVLFGPRGTVCTGRVGELSVVARGLTVSPPREQPSELWKLLAGSAIVAAPLEEIQGDCREALWARDAALPTPAIASPTEVSRGMRTQAIEHFRGQRGSEDLQQQYHDVTGKEGSWFSQDDVAVSAFALAHGTLVVVGATVGDCESFYASRTAAWIVADDTWVPQSLEPLEQITIGGAADMDGDGVFELVGSARHMDRLVLKKRDILYERIASSASKVGMSCGC